MNIYICTFLQWCNNVNANDENNKACESRAKGNSLIYLIQTAVSFSVEVNRLTSCDGLYGVLMLGLQGSWSSLWSSDGVSLKVWSSLQQIWVWTCPQWTLLCKDTADWPGKVSGPALWSPDCRVGRHVVCRILRPVTCAIQPQAQQKNRTSVDMVSLPDAE